MCNNDKCEKNAKDLSFFLDGYIDKTDDDVVVVPRSEYSELIAEQTILRSVERIVMSDIPSYHVLDVIKELLALNNIEEIPAKEPTKPDSERAQNDCLPVSDEEDHE